MVEWTVTLANRQPVPDRAGDVRLGASGSVGHRMAERQKRGNG
jgi:hypothetical protein